MSTEAVRYGAFTARYEPNVLTVMDKVVLGQVSVLPCQGYSTNSPYSSSSTSSALTRRTNGRSLEALWMSLGTGYRISFAHSLNGQCSPRTVLEAFNICLFCSK